MSRNFWQNIPQRCFGTEDILHGTCEYRQEMDNADTGVACRDESVRYPVCWQIRVVKMMNLPLRLRCRQGLTEDGWFYEQDGQGSCPFDLRI